MGCLGLGLRVCLSRSYEEVEAHAREYECETVNGKRLVTKYQGFALKHRMDLLEHCPPKDIREMKEALSDTLREISGEPLPSRQTYRGDVKPYDL